MGFWGGPSERPCCCCSITVSGGCGCCCCAGSGNDRGFRHGWGGGFSVTFRASRPTIAPEKGFLGRPRGVHRAVVTPMGLSPVSLAGRSMRDTVETSAAPVVMTAVMTAFLCQPIACPSMRPGDPARRAAGSLETEVGLLIESRADHPAVSLVTRASFRAMGWPRRSPPRRSLDHARTSNRNVEAPARRSHHRPVRL